MTERVAAVVEGDLDAAVIRRVALTAGLVADPIHIKRGKQNVRGRIAGYNAASRHVPFVVLVDLDTEYECAPELVSNWLPRREPRLCFRVAIHEIEAWLLGDKERIARFLRVGRGNIPNDPESIIDPKSAIVQIAQRSSSRDIRADLVPRVGSGRVVGAAYSSRLIDFVNDTNGWRPDTASAACDSLRRAMTALTALHGTIRLLR